jgi:hypothetical protein
VRAYREGARPDPAVVFQRVAGVYDHFLDFRRSLADQAAMAELSAACSVATWFLPAFTVIGYPWPNGDRGTGKTQFGLVWTHTSYLGEMVLAGGTFAALRDLADAGGAVFFDDCENLADPKRSDPDKRALLLAGNRRGARVPVKELADNAWVTRWVNAFCPRGFSAIRLPDPILESRSLVIPLVRTADPVRGNRDPADLARWPCDPQQLQDDLWATALALLPEAADVWAELDHETSILGRAFEPWRALLAVARLFERHGVAGLEARLRATMAAHQAERAGRQADDRTVLVLRALLGLIPASALPPGAADIMDVLDAADVFRGGLATATPLRVTAQGVADEVKALVKAEEGTEPEWASARAIGWVLERLRITRDRANTRKRARERVITVGELLTLARSYGVWPLLPDPSQPEDRQNGQGEGADNTTGYYPPNPPLKTSTASETSETSARAAPSEPWHEQTARALCRAAVTRAEAVAQRLPEALHPRLTFALDWFWACFDSARRTRDLIVVRVVCDELKAAMAALERAASAASVVAQEGTHV